MSGRAWWSCAVLLIAPTLIGCGQNPYAKWKHLDAVYASQVPIHPSAEFDDAMGGSYYGEDLNDKVSETMTWWFKIDPKHRDEIVAYYEKQLPNAQKTTDEEGSIKFEVTPTGAESGESIEVSISSDKLRISEETKPGKHKES